MKKMKYILALVVLFAMIVLVQLGPIGIVQAFSKLGRGPDHLYNMESYERTENETDFVPGALWKDTEGNVIQAHAGQVSRMPLPDGNGGRVIRYIWIGENKAKGQFGNSFSVYTSDDLYNWENRGEVFRPIASKMQLTNDDYFRELYGNLSEEEQEEIFSCINTGTVIERPRMLYNEATDSYVIWFHNDDVTEDNPSYNYDVGMAGVAVSDSPFGPFRFLYRMRLNSCPDNELDCYPNSKGESRDLNLFQDDDGTAYVVYTSENNKTIYISRLNDEYTDLSVDPAEAVEGVDFVRLFPGAMREAPVLIHRENGRYYLLTSSTSGWISNQARVWSAAEIFGEWRNDGNPCDGQGSSVNFDSQGTSIFQAPNKQWIYFGDRWNSKDLNDSRYIWLPISFDGELLHLNWQAVWSWNQF